LLSLFWVHIWSQDNLLLYSFLIWTVSSVISLFSSIYIIKNIYNIQIVWEDLDKDNDDKISYLYNKLNELNNQYWYKIKLWIYISDEPNAFATWCGMCGYLISFSTSIIEEMDINQLDWVLWHEFAHINNKDVIVTTILQWFLNTFVIYLAHIISDVVTGNNDDNNNSMFNYVLTFILEIVLWIFVSIILAVFSRTREYVADYDSSTKYSNAENMLYSLQRLKVLSDYIDQTEIDNNNNLTSTMKINNFWDTLMWLFSTHPKLNDRIDRILKLINK